MKIVMFSFSLLILLCMAMILCNAIIKDSPMHMAKIVLTSMMFVLSVVLTAITYMELREKC